MAVLQDPDRIFQLEKRLHVMPRFYLHLKIGDDFIEDQEGCDLPDIERARKRAMEGLRDVSAGELRRGNVDLDSFIEIEDENHAPLITVQFAEAVRIRSG